MLQVAANARGIQLVSDLIEEYGLATVQAYMGLHSGMPAAFNPKKCVMSTNVRQMKRDCAAPTG